MKNAVAIPSIERCIEIFGEVDGKSVHKELLRSNFRSATSLKNQLQYLKEIRPNITVRMTTKLLHITNDRYFQAFKDSAISVPLTIQMPHRHLLTLEDEENIISKIKSQQLLNDCLSSKEIRELAEEI